MKFLLTSALLICRKPKYTRKLQALEPMIEAVISKACDWRYVARHFLNRRSRTAFGRRRGSRRGRKVISKPVWVRRPLHKPPLSMGPAA